MKLGVVVTDARFTANAVGLMEAAARRGWPLRCFLTHSGVGALSAPGLQRLVDGGLTTLAVCEFSVERYAVAMPPSIAEKVVIGGQYQNAEIVRWCERVTVF